MDARESNSGTFDTGKVAMFGNKAIVIISLCGLALLSACGSRIVSFSRDVHPILEHNCAVCHSPGGVGFKVSGFDVQSYASIMRGTKYGPMVTPGSSNQSNLLWVLRHGAHPSINMPKFCEQLTQASDKCEVASNVARKLPQAQVKLIARWVDQGARDN